MTRTVVAAVLATLAACGGGGEKPGGPDPEPTASPYEPPSGLGGKYADPGELRPAERPPLPQSPPPLSPGTTLLLPNPDAPFGFKRLQAQVPVYSIDIAPADLAAILADEDENILAPAVFTTGNSSQPVFFRIRGNSSRGWPKKSWRVEFPEDHPFDGRRNLNLISDWRDQSGMIEKLAYDLLAAMNVPASRASYVQLIINGENQGVYLDLERVDKDFANNRPFIDRDPNIYRCGRKDCEMKTWRHEFQHAPEKETNETIPGQADLDQFIMDLHTAPQSELPERLGAILELESYLRMMVAEALFSNDTVEDSRSYMVHDSVTGRWFYAPWDYNNTTTLLLPGSAPGHRARVDQPLWVYTVTDSWEQLEYEKRIVADPSHAWYALFSDLSTRIQFHPDLRSRLLDHLDQALHTLFAPEVIEARIDDMHALTADATVGDPHVDPVLFADGPRFLKDFVSRRRDFLQKALAEERAATPGVVLESVDPAAGRVVIANLGAATVDLTGWVLTTNLRLRPGPNLPVGAVLLPGDRLEVDASLLGLVPDSIGEVGLWRGPKLQDVADVFYFGPVPPGKRWVRSAANPRSWELAP